MIDRARYADDLSTVGLASNPKQVTRRVRDWDNAWSLSCARLLLQHNAGKRQLLVHFVGRGSSEASRHLKEYCCSFALQ
eukprot:4830851-Heterocapsa_arctica.AAC.1